MLTAEQRAYQRNWYHKNKEDRRLAAREYMRTKRAKDPTAEREAGKKWRRKTVIYRKNYFLKKKYGITLEQKNQMFVDQGSRCAICKSETTTGKDWHVDHCHKTQRIRGILCSHCNLMIGHAKDNPQTLLSAAEYLNAQNSIKR